MPYFHILNDSKIYYERHGEKGPVVVLIHGLASSGRIWSSLIRSLEERYQVYTLDLPGHGQSDRWKAYSFESFAETLATWMAYCQIDNAAFVALSLGCSVALTFAVCYPEKVNALVLAGPLGGYHPWWHPRGWWDWMTFKSLPLILHGSVLLFGYRATTHWLNTFGLRSRRNLKVVMAMQNMVDFRAVRHLLWQSAYPPYVGFLDRIQSPAAVIRGCNDPMPERFMRYVQTHIQNACFIEVPDARHLVALEKPHEFNRIIEDFLTQGQAGLQPVIST